MTERSSLLDKVKRGQIDPRSFGEEDLARQIQGWFRYWFYRFRHCSVCPKSSLIKTRPNHYWCMKCGRSYDDSYDWEGVYDYLD